jgi:hypothetical protein
MMSPILKLIASIKLSTELVYGRQKLLSTVFSVCPQKFFIEEIGEKLEEIFHHIATQ